MGYCTQLLYPIGAKVPTTHQSAHSFFYLVRCHFTFLLYQYRYYTDIIAFLLYQYRYYNIALVPPYPYLPMADREPSAISTLTSHWSLHTHPDLTVPAQGRQAEGTRELDRGCSLTCLV